MLGPFAQGHVRFVGKEICSHPSTLVEYRESPWYGSHKVAQNDEIPNNTLLYQVSVSRSCAGPVNSEIHSYLEVQRFRRLEASLLFMIEQVCGFASSESSSQIQVPDQCNVMAMDTCGDLHRAASDVAFASVCGNHPTLDQTI